MSETVTIPQIAITTESNEWNSSSNNIAETLTDVEDLEETSSRKIKSTLKIKIKESGSTTDVEDIEDSDLEDDLKIKTVRFEDLDLDYCNLKENIAGTSGNTSESFKMKLETRSALDDGVTDDEMVTSDNEFDQNEIPDVDVNLDDYQSDYVNISIDLKKQTPHLEHPVQDCDESTDVESVQSGNENKCLLKKSRTRRRKSKRGSKNKEGGIKDPAKATGMKKSFSQPVSLNHQNSWTGFMSDGEPDESNFLKLSAHCTKTKPQEIRRRSVTIKLDSSDDTDFESLESGDEILDFPEMVLPPPTRTIVWLTEDKSLVPTTKILPLDETPHLDTNHDVDVDEDTETELFSDEDDCFTADKYSRGPSPEVCYEASDIHYGESQLNVAVDGGEPVTDTEDFAIDERTRRVKKSKNKTLHVPQTKQDALTETEDFSLSDSSRRSPLKRQNVIVNKDCLSFDSFDAAVNENSDDKNFLNITKPKVLTTSPELTDFEDLVASADEDVRSGAVTPNEFSQHLDQQSSSKVHIENTNKLNMDSPNEMIYLKGGTLRQINSDVEDISDDNDVDSDMTRDWGVSKKSAPQEEVPLPQDAEQQGEESSFAATGPQDSSLKAEGEESGISGQETDRTTSQQRQITDQHQLSDEMKQLLKELEKESKQ